MFLQWLREIFTHPIEDVRIQNPAVDLAINHRTKTAFMFCMDPDTPNGAYVELEKHLNEQGYFLQVFVPPVGLPHAPTASRE